jgi:hypothetical protein
MTQIPKSRRLKERPRSELPKQSILRTIALVLIQASSSFLNVRRNSSALYKLSMDNWPSNILVVDGSHSGKRHRPTDHWTRPQHSPRKTAMGSFSTRACLCLNSSALGAISRHMWPSISLSAWGNMCLSLVSHNSICARGNSLRYI